jgi:hypothetical protein
MFPPMFVQLRREDESRQNSGSFAMIVVARINLRYSSRFSVAVVIMMAIGSFGFSIHSFL